MAFFTMIITLPLLFISYEKKHENEQHYIAKLFLLWLVCQIYIVLNYKIKVPIGAIASFAFIYNEQTNKRSKLTACILGCITFISSNIVYLLYNI